MLMMARKENGGPLPLEYVGLELTEHEKTSTASLTNCASRPCVVRISQAYLHPAAGATKSPSAKAFNMLHVINASRILVRKPKHRQHNADRRHLIAKTPGKFEKHMKKQQMKPKDESPGVARPK